MLGLALLAGLAHLAADCEPLPGWERLFAAKPAVVWVGEVHGTAEEPKLFGDIVCLAAKSQSPPLVALERDAQEQPLWDAFLQSDGAEVARHAFLQGRAWNWEIQDGRSSKAMLALAERLRQLKRQGRILGVAVIQPKLDTPDAAEHEQRMARAVTDAGAAHPGSMVLVLSGNAHARKGEGSARSQTYRLAAAYLPAASTVSVFIRSGPGEAWNCQEDGCGIHKMGGASEVARSVSVEGAPSGFDALAFTGVPTSASPPAARPATWSNLPQASAPATKP
ncbi:MAG: hypothetical protein ACJ798_15950 [Phenylobacterium sp.]